MKQSESYYNLSIIGVCLFLLPFLNIAMSSLWWGFGYVPVLPIMMLVAFFALPQSQYIYSMVLSGWWYDLMIGNAGPNALISLIIGSLVLFAVAQIISSRSLLSDLIVALLLYVVWITVAFIINQIMERIAPASPIVNINSTVLLIGFVSTLIMQLISRHYIIRDNVVPKALS